MMDAERRGDCLAIIDHMIEDMRVEGSYWEGEDGDPKPIHAIDLHLALKELRSAADEHGRKRVSARRALKELWTGNSISRGDIMGRNSGRRSEWTGAKDLQEGATTRPLPQPRPRQGPNGLVAGTSGTTGMKKGNGFR